MSTRRRTNWTEYETARARQLIAEGAKASHFKALTGRSLATARAHIRYIDDPVYRQKCIEATSRYRKTYERRQPDVLPPIDRAERAVVVPPDVIEEAKKRLAAPKSLTGWICGDPPAGYSSLDQRPARASEAATS